jgi:hypothetical protein
MPKTCEIENCPCCFHSDHTEGNGGDQGTDITNIIIKKNPEEKSTRPRGRPAIPKVDDNHKTCRLCKQIKELSEMRAKRNECILCYNESQRNYYKNNETYQKYKKSKSIEQKKKLKELNNSPNVVVAIEEIPHNNPSNELNYII